MSGPNSLSMPLRHVAYDTQLTQSLPRYIEPVTKMPPKNRQGLPASSILPKIVSGIRLVLSNCFNTAYLDPKEREVCFIMDKPSEYKDKLCFGFPSKVASSKMKCYTLLFKWIHYARVMPALLYKLFYSNSLSPFQSFKQHCILKNMQAGFGQWFNARWHWRKLACSETYIFRHWLQYIL